MAGDNYRDLVISIAQQTARVCKEDITDQIYKATSGIVQFGPFAGMRLPDESSWSGGDGSSKLLGCYEQELHSTVEKAIARQPEVLINIGCAEGYYAVGLARRLPTAQVFAFDTDEKAQSICRLAAQLNGVENQLVIEGECTQGNRFRLTVRCVG